MKTLLYTRFLVNTFLLYKSGQHILLEVDPRWITNGNRQHQVIFSLPIDFSDYHSNVYVVIFVHFSCEDLGNSA